MRAGLGLTRANFLGTGAAPLDVETLSFFAKFGMTISDLWGELAGHTQVLTTPIATPIRYE